MQVPVHPQSPENEGESRAPPIRVLVADDDPVVRQFLGTLLRLEEGMQLVGEAGDAEATVREAERLRPDVVLLDVRMPAGGGGEAAREIVERCSGTRVMAFTGSGDRTVAMEMLAAGARGFVVKGAPTEEIVGAIRGVAAGGGVLSASVDSEVQARDDVAWLARGIGKERVQRLLEEKDRATVFQPIVDLRSGGTIGLEALTRFVTEPVGSPSSWFRAAQSAGIGAALELAAAGSALRHLKFLSPGLFLSLNISAPTLTAERLTDLLRLGADRVVLELPASAHIENTELVEEGLRRLRGTGVRVAADDVVEADPRLLQMRPDYLKLDVSLTRGLDADPSARVRAQAIAAFALEAGVPIIAEGVERTGQVEVLRAFGVRYAQGFLLGRPAPLVPMDDEAEEQRSGGTP
jgi:EAL domain-containing protein (putative c-di-GMP-specific phosphodiesterase class I)/DNA-binding NarL/FixJ family response regulator